MRQGCREQATYPRERLRLLEIVEFRAFDHCAVDERVLKNCAEVLGISKGYTNEIRRTHFDHGRSNSLDLRYWCSWSSRRRVGGMI